MCFDDAECVGCAWGVCDGLDRCCDESVVCVVFEGFLSVWDVRCIVMIFEWLELTLVSAVTHVCDCGVIWRLMVLGGEWGGAGARAVGGGWEVGK